MSVLHGRYGVRYMTRKIFRSTRLFATKQPYSNVERRIRDARRTKEILSSDLKVLVNFRSHVRIIMHLLYIHIRCQYTTTCVFPILREPSNLGTTRDDNYTVPSGVDWTAHLRGHGRIISSEQRIKKKNARACFIDWDARESSTSAVRVYNGGTNEESARGMGRRIE